jgi:hypothetical protein
MSSLAVFMNSIILQRRALFLEPCFYLHRKEAELTLLNAQLKCGKRQDPLFRCSILFRRLPRAL